MPFTGRQQFCARRGADNFDDESFARACRQAHLAGARVYVTVNVVVKWDEMQRVHCAQFARVDPWRRCFYHPGLGCLANKGQINLAEIEYHVSAGKHRYARCCCLQKQ